MYDPEAKDVYKTLTKFKDGSYGARLRKDAKLIAAGSGEGQVKLFDLATKTQLRSFKGHTQPAKRLDFLPDNKSVVSFSDDHTVKLWDVAAESMVASFDEHSVSQFYCSKSSSFNILWIRILGLCSSWLCFGVRLVQFDRFRILRPCCQSLGPSQL